LLDRVIIPVTQKKSIVHNSIVTCLRFGTVVCDKVQPSFEFISQFKCSNLLEETNFGCILREDTEQSTGHAQDSLGF